MSDDLSFIKKSNGLKQKTISGLFWSFSDSTTNQVVNFIVGIVLARLLSPAEFGLIGMITVFVAVSQSFIDSGFQQALIRKKDADNADFSTVFYFNLSVGIVLYIILFLLSGLISSFYNEPQLKSIIKVFGLIILINSFALIQRVRLIKAINFKLQTKISFVCSILSGTIGIYMAFNGFGVWSLVFKTLTNQILQAVSLWVFNKWTPSLEFSLKSFKEMFSFGSRVLVSGLINTIYQNVYFLIIGKFFSAVELGYYTRADQFQKLPSNNITSTIQRVTYPVLSAIQEDPIKLKEGYRRLIKATMFISFSAMMVLAAIAKSMVVTLIGEKWLPSVVLLQLLCFAGMLYPLHAMNLNMLNVKGRSDLFLRLEIIKKLLAVPVIIIGILISIKAMVIGMIINSFLAYYINSYYSGRLINYPVQEQIMDIIPSFLLASGVSFTVFMLTLLLKVNSIIMFTGQMILAIFLLISLSELFKLASYLEIKTIVFERAIQLFKKNEVKT